jgi:hypothetical protein
LTRSEDVESVRCDLEASLACMSIELAFELLLDRVFELDVDDRSARVAGEMVVMARELLGQLEACVSRLTGAQATDDVGSLEHRQVAVDAAQLQARIQDEDVLDRQRVVGRVEEVDQLSALSGVAASGALQAVGCYVVHVHNHSVEC